MGSGSGTYRDDIGYHALADLVIRHGSLPVMLPIQEGYLVPGNESEKLAFHNGKLHEVP